MTLALMFGRAVPVDHHLALDLPKGAGAPCEMQVAWASADDEDLSGGARISIPFGRPRSIAYSFRAPAGEYRLTVTVLRPKERGSCTPPLVAHPMKSVELELGGGHHRIHLSPSSQ